jgi:hypothetical protein
MYFKSSACESKLTIVLANSLRAVQDVVFLLFSFHSRFTRMSLLDIRVSLVFSFNRFHHHHIPASHQNRRRTRPKHLDHAVIVDEVRVLHARNLRLHIVAVHQVEFESKL